jgi:hypothetical protein
MKIYFFFLTILPGFCSEIFFLTEEEKTKREVSWESAEESVFDELLLTWHAERPLMGSYTFFVKVKQEGVWSPWLFYAEWSSIGQIMFKHIPENSFAFAYEGRIQSKKGKCEDFAIQIEASGGAQLQNVTSVSAVPLNRQIKQAEAGFLPSAFLENFPRQSQITLRHLRYTDLSLPVCVSLVVNYLGESKIDPKEFAELVIDNDSAFYENWSFNAAQGSTYLKGKQFTVCYLSSFDELHVFLKRKRPVIVPIIGWIPGGLRPYRTEHALCIIGYDETLARISCIDPAFPNDKSTLVSYALSDFLPIWAKLHNKAIVVTDLPSHLLLK